MELDLGVIPKAKVKVGADVFEMSVPTVKQAISLNKKLDECKEDLDRTLVFIDMLEQLGMPKETVEQLSVVQMTKLAEGLMGDAGKK